MKFSYKITAETGIHGRVAANISSKCKEFDSSISVIHNGRIGNARSTVSLVGLIVKQVDVVNVIIDDDDECQVYSSLKAYFKENL